MIRLPPKKKKNRKKHDIGLITTNVTNSRAGKNPRRFAGSSVGAAKW